MATLICVHFFPLILMTQLIILMSFNLLAPTPGLYQFQPAANRDIIPLSAIITCIMISPLVMTSVRPVNRQDTHTHPIQGQSSRQKLQMIPQRNKKMALMSRAILPQPLMG